MRRLLPLLALLATALGLVLAGAAPAASADGRYALTTFTRSGGMGGPQSIAAGPDGNLWFVSSQADVIGRITPAGAVTLFNSSVHAGIPSDPLVDGPTDITLGPDGEMWFTLASSNRVGRINPMGFDIDTFPSGAPGSARPHSLVTGPDNHLWITADANSGFDDNDYLIEMTSTGATTGTVYQSALIKSPRDIASAGGSLWFSSFSNDRVIRASTAGALTEFGPGAGAAQIDGPQGIALGPDNNLWVASSSNDRVVRMTTGGVFVNGFSPTGLDSPQDVTGGPDGRVWVTAGGFPNKIFRLTTTGGQVASFANVNTVNGPAEVVSGPDGNLWFAIQSSGSIGRLTIPRCGGQLATVLLGAKGFGAATAGADVIVGTAANDTINGKGGADRICGLAGNDTLGGQAGNDVLYGGRGKDKLFGGPNNDACHGQRERDTASGCETRTGIP